MRRALSVTAAVALLTAVFSSPAHADAPDEFGTDWDDPISAVAPVERPDTDSCEVVLVDHVFDDFEPFESEYTPPAECAGDWSKVVLDLTGAVSGRQYDRMGTLTLGGVPVFNTSTPQPSPEGIEWQVEKDLTGYQALFRQAQPVVMELGNLVDDVHNGVFDITVTVTFYAADEHYPVSATSDRVLPLDDAQRVGTDLVGSVTVPQNSVRLLADVYATGSGGGCEEFWYLTAPPEAGYSCESSDGPYREVQVLVDGRVAGIAIPYPAVYTGGWSNPFLWYNVPAPRAFDLRPITYDLTPYLGLLNDGKAHEVTVRVAGVDAETDGWATPTAFRVWQDHESSVVPGGLLSSNTTQLRNTWSVTVNGDETQIIAEAGHQHTVTGWLETSDGRILTTVDRVLTYSSTHAFGEAENPDALGSNWRDVETRTVLAASAEAEVRKTDRRYQIDGQISLDDADRLTTSIVLHDNLISEITSASQIVSKVHVNHGYLGKASWTINVPREERDATGTSSVRFQVRWDAGSGNDACFDRHIRSRNGYVISDRQRC